MRYLGDPTLINTLTPNPLDPAIKAQMLALAVNLPDDKARDLLDLADATPYGGRQRWIRMGIGAGVGLAVGVVLGRALGRR